MKRQRGKQPVVHIRVRKSEIVTPVKRVRGNTDSNIIICLVCDKVIHHIKDAKIIPADANHSQRFRHISDRCEPGSRNWAKKFPDSFMGKYYYESKRKEKLKNENTMQKEVRRVLEECKNYINLKMGMEQV